MCAKDLRVGARKMSISENVFVEEASTKASWLVNRESRGPGDIPGAMRRIEQRYGISYATLMSLRYRRPKDILISTYVRISEAHRAECERQKRLMEHETTIADARTKLGRIIDRAADALDRRADALVSKDGEAVK